MSELHCRPIWPLPNSPARPSRGARTVATGELAYPTRSDQQRTRTSATHRLNALAALDRASVAHTGVAPGKGTAVGESDKGEDGERVVDKHSARVRRAGL